MQMEPRITTAGAADLRAPFPWFGGKSRVAGEVWRRFGDVRNYVEPFFGSGAVLLGRPSPSGVETVNDADGLLTNFWRAVKADPVGLAEAIDYPVSEIDLHARHYWLVTEGRERVAGLAGDPDAYDMQAAAWWVWGCCAWIGGGWCSGEGPWQWTGSEWVKRDAGQGVYRRLPHLFAGRGVNRQLPHLGGTADSGRGVHRPTANVESWLAALSTRLRRVRISSGDWHRVTGPSVTWRQGLTGIFLDPPYDPAQHCGKVYGFDGDVRLHEMVRAYAQMVGAREDCRVALCCYDDGADMPRGWVKYAWKTNGGYGSQGNGRGRENAKREVIWFSPACIAPEIGGLFHT